MGMRPCNEDCNHCPIICHPNNRLLTKILNELLDKFGNGVYEIVQGNCPNLTVCYDCRIDDFCHTEGCELVDALNPRIEPRVEKNLIEPQEHVKRHKFLHKHFDELLADFIHKTGKPPSQTSLIELVHWSHAQTTNPSTEAAPIEGIREDSDV